MRVLSLLAVALTTVLISAPDAARAQTAAKSPAAQAPTAATARAFLLSVYRHYQYGGKGVDFEGPNASLYFHSSLLALIRADIKANGPGYVPAVDFDPVCSCQDWKGIWGLKIELTMETPKRAHANVSFSLAPPKDRATDASRQLILTLVPEHGAWRIYDVEDDSDSSTTFALRKLIEDDMASIGRHSEPDKPH
jgi:hypothetical protein